MLIKIYFKNKFQSSFLLTKLLLWGVPAPLDPPGYATDPSTCTDFFHHSYHLEQYPSAKIIYLWPDTQFSLRWTSFPPINPALRIKNSGTFRAWLPTPKAHNYSPILEAVLLIARSYPPPVLQLHNSKGPHPPPATSGREGVFRGQEGGCRV